jgi:hypothetical protein
MNMKKYAAQVKMINIVQVEVELPEYCDQHTIEIQAAIEAKSQYGDADHIEIMEYQEETEG